MLSGRVDCLGDQAWASNVRAGIVHLDAIHIPNRRCCFLSSCSPTGGRRERFDRVGLLDIIQFVVVTHGASYPTKIL